MSLLVGHSVNAGLLLIAGRREQRTWLLGVFFLLKATHAPQWMLPAFLLELPPPPMLPPYAVDMPLATMLFLILYVPSFVFAPAFLWAFARECPRVQRRTRLDTLALRMFPISIAIGCAGWATWIALLLVAQTGRMAGTLSLAMDGLVVGLQSLALAAVVVVALARIRRRLRRYGGWCCSAPGFCCTSGWRRPTTSPSCSRPGTG